MATFTALDLYGTKGTRRRRRVVLIEFVVGTVAMTLFGGFLLSRGAWAWGGWLLGCVLNYAALTVHAVRLRRQDRLTTALEGFDVGSELRRYSVAQILLFVPGVVAIAAVAESVAASNRQP